MIKIAILKEFGVEYEMIDDDEYSMINYVISTIVAIVCYVLILLNGSSESNVIIISSFSLIIGRIVSKGLRTMWNISGIDDD